MRFGAEFRRKPCRGSDLRPMPGSNCHYAKNGPSVARKRADCALGARGIPFHCPFWSQILANFLFLCGEASFSTRAAARVKKSPERSRDPNSQHSACSDFAQHQSASSKIGGAHDTVRKAVPSERRPTFLGRPHRIDLKTNGNASRSADLRRSAYAVLAGLPRPCRAPFLG